jgi:ferritin
LQSSRSVEGVRIMLNKKVEESINKQIVAELYSAYLYFAMAAYFETENLNGMGQWMKAQAFEEMYHAMKFYDYVNERGGRVVFLGIDKPPEKWDSPLATFTAAYDHEVKVTGMINDLVDIARSENDKATESFLNWYVDEQVEEEANADEIVNKLKLMAGAPGGLFMLDEKLGQRTYIWPGVGTEGE